MTTGMANEGNSADVSDSQLPLTSGATAPAVRFRISKDDFRRAQWLHIKPRPVYAVLGALLLTLMAVVLVYAVFRTIAWDLNPPIVLVFAFAYLLFIVVFRRWKIGRIYDQMKALHGEFTMTVDERGIHSRSERGQATMLYGDILRIREDERIMLVYHADNLFNMIPKSSSPLLAAAASIREHRQQYIIAQRSAPPTG
jgi:hypothetical protein